MRLGTSTCFYRSFCRDQMKYTKFQYGRQFLMKHHKDDDVNTMVARATKAITGALLKKKHTQNKVFMATQYKTTHVTFGNPSMDSVRLQVEFKANEFIKKA